MWGSKLSWGSTSERKRKRIEVHVDQVNDSLYTLHKPGGTPTMQIIFFHGLYLEDSLDTHLYTWESGDGSCIWPQTWLVEDFPGAHVLTVSYCECVRNNANMYVIGENLTQDLEQGEIGQIPGCPVVLVEHSVGGLVIKQLCLHAHDRLHLLPKTKSSERAKLETFLDNIKGIFYYSTPHCGSSHVAEAGDLESPLFEYFKALNTEASQMNYRFQHLCALHTKWLIHGIGESLPTNSALIRGVVVVPEASARQGQCFAIVAGDHYSICKPKSKKLKGFTALTYLLVNIQEEDGPVAEPRPQNFQCLPSYFISVRVNEIIGMLKNNRQVGIVGMGGTGKTVLAKAVFNELNLKFEYSCFVPDMGMLGSMVIWREVVWEYIHCHGKKVEEGDWSTLRGKKLLIVFDDWSDRDVRVLWDDLASTTSLESRFIVTCRNGDLLSNLDLHAVYEVPIYEVLNEKDAMALFMTYAFPNTAEPPVQFGSIAKGIVQKCGGLPLTLEVLGKYLRRIKDFERWEQTLDALNRAGEVDHPTSWDRLQGPLMLSIDALGETERQMFLDAATFFSGNENWTLREALAAWREVYKTSSERLMWQNLVNMSLVYHVEPDEKIEMHEQLRDLGRKIASEPNNNSRCRVWDGTVASKLLRSADGLEGKEFHALRLAGDSERIHIARSTLAKLKRVRYLEAKGPVIMDRVRDGELLPTELVLLMCVGDLLFDPAPQPHLTVLKTYDVESFPRSFGGLSSLRYLQINRKLRDLPESFGMLSQLNHLEFNHCHNLHTLPYSFGQLRGLIRLAFNHCDELGFLPDSFGHLSSLDCLEFDHCGKLQCLPESFGQLSSLNCLKFNHCDELQCLPDSFGLLFPLNRLEFNHRDKLQCLPESSGQLPSLGHLEFNHCNKLQRLPDSFGHLSSLIRLEFNHCDELGFLPDSFGSLSSLGHLEFNHCDKLGFLPDSFGYLSSLGHLEFNHCNKLQRLPESCGQLSSLNCLKFNHCDSLQILPDSLGNLCSLTDLRFLGCRRLQSLPNSFGELSSLNHLGLDDCGSLHSFPESFGQLPELQYLGITVGRHMDVEGLLSLLGNIRSLRQLELSFQGFNINIPDCIKSSPSLCSLILHLPRFPLPPWLDENDMADNQFEKLIFEVQDGHFSLIERSREVSGCLAGTKEISHPV